ncbi:MAG: S8 family serine peptidase, partial [Gammaproteobacteria bacterium]|nr:S8 family serine peptidase [Gemmatimonadota bacterium]NIU72157.1 S8 family serine peptidase [Gammaproteobacteria bacterium]
GIGIVSAASSTAAFPQERLVTDGVHAILEGTSQSAPHVTGILALLLEHEPTLTPTDVRDILSRTATQDEFTTRTYGSVPGTDATSWWGYG